ncbi:MAG: N-acetylmuramoyl-L-alanine amidase [Alphaproteobacteria bacterium]|jgi:N-acetylmuramoyl-L-alanine amidase
MPADLLIDRPVSWQKSPNHDARPDGATIDILILHYTGMASAAAALDRMCDPNAKVSAHYLVDEDGAIVCLVDESRRAWHAGQAQWRGRDDINGTSIGIEMVNPGHEFGYRAFPEKQMAAVIDLCLDITARHPIPARHVLGHGDVAYARRADPGEYFDWSRLAAAGIGLWPKVAVVTGEMGLILRKGDGGTAVGDIRRALAEFGYGVAAEGAFDTELEQAVIAFQRHFRPGCLDGVVDPETAQRIFQILALA